MDTHICRGLETATQVCRRLGELDTDNHRGLRTGRRVCCLLLLASALAACDGDSRDNREAVNAAPTVSAIADQAFSANQPTGAIDFTVADENLASLDLEAMSDNEQLVPPSGIALGGSGGDRSVTVTPVNDTVGDAFITIVATDQAGLSAGSTFLLTIEPEQASLQQFTRDSFADGADGDPELVNAVEFDRDAEGDDFADLLNP